MKYIHWGSFIFMYLFLPGLVFGQVKFDLFISNTGSDSNPGTSLLLPKKTMAGISPLLRAFANTKEVVKVGLRSGDLWNENLIATHPIELTTYSNDGGVKDFAILNGSKEFGTGWELQPGSAFSYKQAIPYSGFSGYGINGIGSYSYIYVIEIDRELEKTAPFTARRLLKFATELSELESNPGSFHTPVNTTENPIPVYIHTSDGSSPNGHPKYRYEVAVKDWAVNSTYQENNYFENLWVRGFGAGNGMLPGGANSYYNKIIFGPGASIHHLVVRSGTINHSLFLPAPKNTNGYALVFYDTEGLGRHCTIKNSMFLDVRLPVYAHTSNGTNYGAVELDNVIGFADSTETTGFMYTNNNDTVLLNKVYTDGYTTGYYYGNAKYASIRNSWFKDVSYGLAYAGSNPVTSDVRNIFIKTKRGSYSSGIILQNNTTLTLSNSIIHISSNRAGRSETTADFIYGSPYEGQITATGNIFICDIDPLKSLLAATNNTDSGVATSRDRWSNNVYILLKGKNIFWSVTNPATNGGNLKTNSFEVWKQQSGQDSNSLFFDLRHDNRGLKAIFADPENGNYQLANTSEGNQIAALRAGMTEPITCFLQKPSFEQAAILVKNEKTLSPNSCKNPCQQNKISSSTGFAITGVNKRQVNLKWSISEQMNIDHYELQRAQGYLLFTRVASFPVNVDSTYSYTDVIQPGIDYRYRLVLISRTGEKCFSEMEAVRINDDKPFNLFPNPSTGKLMVSASGYVGRTNFTVINALGQPMLEKVLLSLYRPVELDLSRLPKGSYFLKIETNNSVAVQKFSLQ